MHAYKEQSFEQVCARVEGDGNVIDFRNLDSRDRKTVLYGLYGKSCPVFNSIESLFLDSSNKLAVAHYRCRGISVVRIDSEYFHCLDLLTLYVDPVGSVCFPQHPLIRSTVHSRDRVPCELRFR